MKMPVTIMTVLTAGALGLAGGCAGTPPGANAAEMRMSIDTMARDTLKRMYAESPQLKSEIERAPGYAVFQKKKVDVLLVSGGSGFGEAVDRAGRRTYMKMAMGGLGPGVGAKDYRVVLVFPSRYVFDKFTQSGWIFGAQVEATSGGEGGDAERQKTFADVKVYQLTENGLLAGATATGTKYTRYNELNP